MSCPVVILVPRLVAPDPPELVPFFDDAGSYVHAGLGALLAFQSAGIRAAGVLAFLVYQMSEREPLANKLGDFGELGAGYLAAEMFRGIR